MSFIVPALNAESTLAVCLQALRAAASRYDFEILLIDNGSTDDTVNVARRFGATVVSAPHLRVPGLRNLGARLARGALLAFVDADCVIEPDWLHAALPAFSDDRVAAVGAPTHVPPNATWVQTAWSLHRLRGCVLRAVEWLPSENLVVRRTAFEAVGRFNEKLETCEDVDFCYRLRDRFTILCDPRVRAWHFGEAPTLREFFRKERWRGQGNLRGFAAHAFRLSELPSVLLPLYYAAVTALGVCALLLLVTRDTVSPLLLASCLAIVPPVVLAVRTCARARRLRWIAPAAIVYLTYAIARLAAVLPGLRPRHRAQATASRR